MIKEIILKAWRWFTYLFIVCYLCGIAFLPEFRALGIGMLTYMFLMSIATLLLIQWFLSKFG